MAQVVAKELQSEARIKQLEGDIKEMTDSTGWKLTEPLRRLNARRKNGGRRRF